jgi:hypothetical protein
LFRLTPGLEQEISEVMADEHSHAELTALLRKNREAVLKELSGMAEGRVLRPVEGPLSIGSGEHLLEASAIQEMAAYYRVSLETGRRAFPYFGVEE